MKINQIRIYILAFVSTAMILMGGFSAYLGNWKEAILGSILFLFFSILTVAFVAQKKAKEQSHKIIQILKKGKPFTENPEFDIKLKNFLFQIDYLFFQEKGKTITKIFWFNENKRAKSKIVDTMLAFLEKNPDFVPENRLTEEENSFLENNLSILKKDLIQIVADSAELIDNLKTKNGHVILMRKFNEPKN